MTEGIHIGSVSGTTNIVGNRNTVFTGSHAVNRFYATHRGGKQRHPFDLTELSDTTWRGMGIAVSDGHGNYTELGGGGTSPTTVEDYDEHFLEALVAVEPVYDVHGFLSHHYEHYKRQSPHKEETFLLRVQYVILPLVPHHKAALVELIFAWLNGKRSMLMQKQLQEKNTFLRRAYEMANETLPSSPLSVNINPTALGEQLGFAEEVTTRVVTELQADGYATSSIGMDSFFITGNGVKYLRQTEIQERPMTQSQKLDAILGRLYDFRYDGKYYSLTEILANNGVKATFNEVFALSKDAERRDLVTLLPQHDDVMAAITTVGVARVEKEAAPSANAVNHNYHINVSGQGNVVSLGDIVDSVIANTVSLAKSGNEEIGNALKTLSAAISESGEIDIYAKQKYLEQIKTLSDEALKPFDQRLPKSVLETIIKYGLGGLTAVASVAEVWQAWGETIASYFLS